MTFQRYDCSHKNFNESCDSDQVLCNFGLEHATINPSTKFEVCICTSYKDTKGDSKCGKLGGLGVIRSHSWPLEMAEFDRAQMRFVSFPKV